MWPEETRQMQVARSHLAGTSIELHTLARKRGILQALGNDRQWGDDPKVLEDKLVFDFNRSTPRLPKKDHCDWCKLGWMAARSRQLLRQRCSILHQPAPGNENHALSGEVSGRDHLRGRIYANRVGEVRPNRVRLDLGRGRSGFPVQRCNTVRWLAQ